MRRADNTLYQSERRYLTDYNVKARDLIDGQSVIATKEYYDFDGSYIYTEAYV